MNNLIGFVLTFQNNFFFGIFKLVIIGNCTNGLNEIGYIYQSDLKLFLHVILC